MAFLVTAVCASSALFSLFSSPAFGANLTREYKILKQSSINFANLALFGSPSQSSTYSNPCKPRAVKAKDGNTEGVFYPWCAVTQTNKELNAWWEIDLLRKSVVYSVVLFNRVDCCMDRLSNFDVILKNEHEEVLKSFHEAQGGIEILAYPMDPSVTSVYYVRVQLRDTNYLSLAEVHVYGKNEFVQVTNWALYRPATQSSTKNDSCQPTASVAVDGNTEGVYDPWCSVTQTNKDWKAWWQVDLQDERIVNLVRVYNRVDCCMERLANFNISLIGTDGKTRDRKNIQGGTDTQVYFFTLIFGTRTRYVRVYLLGEGILSLAEVQVYGWY